MSRPNDWRKAARDKRTKEQAAPTGGGPTPGPWTHVKREPVRTFSKAEIAAFLAERQKP